MKYVIPASWPNPVMQAPMAVPFAHGAKMLIEDNDRHDHVLRLVPEVVVFDGAVEEAERSP